ncbi:GTP-binding protein gtr1 [Coemansia sp. RSA 988]|nr:GTP-binding protein gtr1 [Coemansia sp. RSA 988]
MQASSSSSVPLAVKKKLVIMGKSGAGKTSMRSLIFSNYTALDTQRLGATIDVEHSTVQFMGDLNLNIWDCGGQHKYLDNYLTEQKENIFGNVEVLIYVFDLETTNRESEYVLYDDCLANLVAFSKDAKVYCLVHKMDKIGDQEQKIATIESYRRALAKRSDMFKPDVYGTSIWDHTLYQAWSQIVYKLVPNMGTIERHLQNFCKLTDASEVVLFERATFLVVCYTSTDQLVPVDKYMSVNYHSVQNVPVVTEGPEAELDTNSSIQDICRAKKRQLFKGSLLEQLHPEFFDKHFGKYPDVKGDNLDEFPLMLLYVLFDTSAEWLSELQMSGEEDSPIITEDLRGEKYILLVDEYDAPIIHTFQSNWNAQIEETALSNIRLLYSIMIKDNDYLYKGLLTGVFKVSLVDLGSGTDSIEEFDLVRMEPMFINGSAGVVGMDAAGLADASVVPTFAGTFLFNEDEGSGLVGHVIESIPALEQYEENIRRAIHNWYIGYVVGGYTGRFNLWSVLSFIKSIGAVHNVPSILTCEDIRAKNYWVETGSHNIIIQELLRERAGYIPVLGSFLSDYATPCGQISVDHDVISTDKRLSVMFSLYSMGFTASGLKFTLDQLLMLCLDAGYLVMRSQTTIGISDGELFRRWRQFCAKLIFGEQGAAKTIQHPMHGRMLNEL